MDRQNLIEDDYEAQTKHRGALTRAQLLLHEGNNRVVMVLGLIVTVTLGLIPFLLATGVWYFYDAEALAEQSPAQYDLLNGLTIAALVVSFALVLFPLIFGYFRLGSRMRQGEAAEMKDLFYAFTSPRRYGRAMLFLVMTVIRFFLYLFLYALFAVLSDQIGYIAILPALAGFAFLLYGTGVFCGYAAALVRREDTGAFRLLRETVVTNQKRLRSVFRFRLQFLGTLALCLVTFGVYALVQGFPLMVLSYEYYSE